MEITVQCYCRYSTKTGQSPLALKFELGTDVWPEISIREDANCNLNLKLQI